MADVIVKKLIESGVHFGHSASRWNPKMAPYIYARKNQLHIIDIRETVRGLLRARKYISQVVEAGSLVLFVGTKRQAGGVIQREALRAGMPFVNERWLGGTLTNFRTIRSRMSRLEELEELRGSEELKSYSKKMQSSLNREYRKMHRNLDGLRSMNRLPECVVVIDPKKEKNSVREARKMGIASIALIDTDCDPDDVDLPIPGNDDGIRSIEMVIGYMADAVMAAKGITDPIAEVMPFQLLTPPAVDIPVADSPVTEDAPAEEEAAAEEPAAEETPAEEAVAAEEPAAEETPAEEAVAAEEPAAEETPAEEAVAAEEPAAEETPVEEAVAAEEPAAEETPAEEEVAAEEPAAEETPAEETGEEKQE